MSELYGLYFIVSHAYSTPGNPSYDEAVSVWYNEKTNGSANGYAYIAGTSSWKWADGSLRGYWGWGSTFSSVEYRPIIRLNTNRQFSKIAVWLDMATVWYGGITPFSMMGGVWKSPTNNHLANNKPLFSEGENVVFGD